MLRRLRIKFIIFNMVIVTVMLCTIFGLLYYSTSHNLEQESLQMMESIALNPIQAGLPNEAYQDIRLPYFTVMLNRAGEPMEIIGGYFDVSDEDFVAELLREANNTRKQSGVLEEYNLRFCRVSTPVGNCVVFSDMTSEQSTLKNLTETFMLIGVLAFLGFLTISIVLAHWAVKPVDEAWKQQKQFVADASHELKTPLTVIMTNAELLSTSECTSEERRQFSGNILTMSKQMRGLLEKLLELARIDNNDVKTELKRVSFSEIVSDAILPFEPVFFERNMILRSEIERNISLNGNAEHLKQVIDILLDNAQKYGTPGGRTIVRLKRTAYNRCRLEVSNQGEPLGGTELKDIFKRFYRADKARTMSHSYGLGLSIAQSIVEEHNGYIWAESKEGYNSFYVELSADNK